MRALSFLLLVTMCSCDSKERPGDPLDEARRLARQGKFEQALQKHIWIHDHVLEANPSYYGVRLSFALADWIDLGKKYPKALETLRGIRDKKVSRLLAGGADRDLFNDVEAINKCLGESKATVELFKKIEAAQPGFASSIYDLADEALFKAQEYDLAKKCLGDPKAKFSTAKANFDQGMQFARTSRNGDATRRAFESIFTHKVVRIIVVLDKTGDRTVAQEIQSDALAVLDNPAIRGAISK